jgi:hypothetical protein
VVIVAGQHTHNWTTKHEYFVNCEFGHLWNG